MPGKKGIKIVYKDFTKSIPVLCIKPKIPNAKIIKNPIKVIIDKIKYWYAEFFILYPKKTFVNKPTIKAENKYPIKIPPVGPFKITWIPPFPVKTGSPKIPIVKKIKTDKNP